MHKLIDQHRTEIALLCQSYGVRRLEVFGSAARGIDFDPDRSDADFLVDFVRESEMSPLHQFFGFAEALERLLGRPVDLVERGVIEANRNYILRRHILANAEPVYGQRAGRRRVPAIGHAPGGARRTRLSLRTG